MFSNFKTAFKEQPLYQIKIPQAVLAAISKDLPEGFKYVELESGYCGIETDKEFIISFDNINLTEKAKRILPKNPTMKDIWSYAYNTQQKLELLPDENGCCFINGQAIKMEDFIKAPLQNVEYEGSSFYMVPPPFPEPFSITVGAEEKNISVLMQRQPWESLTEAKFSSVNDSAIKVSYIFDEMTQQITFSISSDIGNAKSVREIIDANHICNAFLQGEGLIMGSKIAKVGKKKDYRISDDVIIFWNKVLELEEYFGVNFDPREGLTEDTINEVEELYRGIIQKKAFRRNETINDVTGSYSKISAEVHEMIGKEIYFEMSSLEATMLFGVEIKWFMLLGIFNATVKSIDALKKDGSDNVKMALKPSSGKKIYSSVMLFKNEEELRQYKDNPEHINLLRDAELLTY